MGPLAITAAAGGVLSAAGQIYEGQAAYKAGLLNAGMLKLKASQIRQQTIEQERQLLVNARKVVGDTRAAYGASGVTMEGSPLDIMEESLTNINRDQMNVRYSGELNARQAEWDADLAVKQGKAARTASYFGAASSILGAGTKAAEYNKLSRT